MFSIGRRICLYEEVIENAASQRIAEGVTEVDEIMDGVYCTITESKIIIGKMENALPEMKEV